MHYACINCIYPLLTDWMRQEGRKESKNKWKRVVNIAKLDTHFFLFFCWLLIILSNFFAVLIISTRLRLLLGQFPRRDVIYMRSLACIHKMVSISSVLKMSVSKIISLKLNLPEKYHSPRPDPSPCCRGRALPWPPPSARRPCPARPTCRSPVDPPRPRRTRRSWSLSRVFRPHGRNRFRCLSAFP